MNKTQKDLNGFPMKQSHFNDPERKQATFFFFWWHWNATLGFHERQPIGTSVHFLVLTARTYSLQELWSLVIIVVHHTQSCVAVNHIGPTEKSPNVWWRHRVQHLEEGRGEQTFSASLTIWLDNKVYQCCCGTQTWCVRLSGMRDRKVVRLGNLNPRNEASKNL